jgi:catechol 2,3-dioxygenase-like lactoylglutathione lyase family enzyme
MTIMRIEGVVYGVDDLEACTRFYADVGLELLRADQSVTVFRTPVNQTVVLRKADDPALPPLVGASPGIREVIWGVDTPAGLAAIRRELASDREVTVDAEGTLHTRDQVGYHIAFRVAAATPVGHPMRDYNTPTEIHRVNRRLTARERPQPVALIHIALDAPKAGHDAANEFYLHRLRFKAIDDSRPVGVFMQCEGDTMHHNLLFVHRTDAIGTNHVAIEVRDFDEVIEAGNYMTDRGWKESRRLGRHTLGSNVFRFFQNPCGGRIEFVHDMDRMDKSWETRVWEKAPPHHLWMVKFPGDPERGAGERAASGSD